MLNLMENKKNFDYDEFADSLIISNKVESDIVVDNFMFDDIVLSLSNEGKICSIEILNASNYLTEIGLNPEILRDIKDIRLNVTQKKDSVVIMFDINSIVDFKEEKNKIPLGMIPIPVY